MRIPARGATLVELAIVVVVVAATSAIALPSMGDLLQRQRASTVGNRVLAELAHARTEAVRRRRQIVVCPSPDQSTCIDGGDWSRGFIAQVEPRGRAGEPLILRTLQGEDLDGYRLVSGRGRPRLVFLADGRAAGTNLTLSLCDGRRLLRQIVVSNTGRARVATPEVPQSCP